MSVGVCIYTDAYILAYFSLDYFHCHVTFLFGTIPTIVDALMLFIAVCSIILPSTLRF